MGKVRIKQIGSGFEELKKPKRKIEKKRTTASVVSGSGSPNVEEKHLTLRKTLSEKATTSVVSGSGSPDVVKRARHPRQKYDRSARYKKLAKAVGATRGSPATKKTGGSRPAPTIRDAIRLAKQTATAKFTESIEAHINVLKTGFSAAVSLPYSTGKKRSILILTADPKALKSVAFKEFESDALDIQIAGSEKIDVIKKSDSPPDVNEIWATPDIMKDLAKIARILGPAGLMPNPKRGTVIGKKTSGVSGSGSPNVDEYTNEITAKLKQLTSGRAVLETERKAPVIHTVLGKASMDEKKLTANMEAILSALGTKNIKKVVLSSTMGPAIRLAL